MAYDVHTNFTNLQNKKFQYIKYLNIAQNIEKKSTYSYQKIEEIYFQIQIWSTFSKYFNIQYKYIEGTKRKILCTYSKIQIFFHTTNCPIFCGFKIKIIFLISIK